MSLHNNLKKLQKIKKKEFHPLIRHVHNKHNISKKTLFYVKEYCSNRNVISVIIKESLKILVLASIISVFGGLGLEKFRGEFISLLPLIILFPVLNDMVGDYSIIFSSRYSTMLHEGKIKAHPLQSKELKKLLVHLVIIGLFTAVLASIFSLVFSGFKGFHSVPLITLKVMLIAVLDVIFVCTVLFTFLTFFGKRVYNRGEDPSNLLIPLSTSIADLVSILTMAGLIFLFF